MATSVEYIEFVCTQMAGVGSIRYRKMFGDYMIYVNDKPVLLVCDNQVFVKQLAQLQDKMQGSKVAFPYDGAKPHYVLDIENAELSKEVVTILEAATPIPKPKKKR